MTPSRVAVYVPLEPLAGRISRAPSRTRTPRYCRPSAVRQIATLEAEVLPNTTVSATEAHRAVESR
ncbi:hypothetical protein [Mycobacterium sp. MS1601]|uniref:hypothetical protein n=1 Tax=Mycobacterium sp. MS1601 TaxID=1936029 RepID=UPI0012F954E5|nr:hypothetical protein [Mycobacterium sp. MS1601]